MGDTWEFLLGMLVGCFVGAWLFCIIFCDRIQAAGQDDYIKGKIYRQCDTLKTGEVHCYSIDTKTK